VLKHGEVNPLNVFGLRKLEHCPPHFERVEFEPYANEKSIQDWIYENLSGRFYVGYHDVTNNSGQFQRQMIVAFELPSESSYFSLFLPQINPQPVW
jgi:hypothetical protein